MLIVFWRLCGLRCKRIRTFAMLGSEGRSLNNQQLIPLTELFQFQLGSNVHKLPIIVPRSTLL